MKGLKIQDVHVSPIWIEESKKHVAKIVEVAKAENVEFILSAGDFFDRQVMASDKSNWKDILKMARDLQEAAQVFYVSGTPSHDSPGCYESFKDIGWKEITIGQSELCTIIDNSGAAKEQLLIMGIPELTPDFIIAKFPELSEFSKIEVISKQYEAVNNVIDSYYGPLAAEHDGPVIFMGHGHISGAKFRDDQKPRSSEFMYSEEMLNRIGADHIQFGHIHLPQEYYGGSAHITWNDLNFKPGFDVIEFDEFQIEIDGKHKVHSTRYYYGEPERQKLVIKEISELSDINKKIRSGANVWIDIECDKSFAEQFDAAQSLKDLKAGTFIGPLSKITTNIQHVENVRVDTEEYEAAKTLEDVYKIFDSEVSESILLKVREAEEKTHSDNGSTKKHVFNIESLYLKGTKAGMENGVEEIKVDFNEFDYGANILTGANGTGKSFTLGFCTPFSEHLPTGTDLKSLFELKDSQIIRVFSDGENIITQKILIDPTLSSPSAKFYMDINKEPIENVTGNKAPFDEAVENIFGSIKMFMTCVFRGQKENNKYPSLENAKEGDLRKIFTEILGIDRGPLKAYAHDKAMELKRSAELELREKETLETILEDTSHLNESISISKIAIKGKENRTIAIDLSIKSNKRKLELIDVDINDNKNINESKDKLKTEKSSVMNDITNQETRIRIMSEALSNGAASRAQLIDLESKGKEFTKVQGELSELQGIYTNNLSEWNIKKKNIDLKIESISDKADKVKEEISRAERCFSDMITYIKRDKTIIISLNIPCDKCGELSDHSEEAIKQHKEQIKQNEEAQIKFQSEIERYNKNIAKYRQEYKNVRDSIGESPQQPERINLLKVELEKFRVAPEALEAKKLEVSELDSISDRIRETKLQIKQYELRVEKIEIEAGKLTDSIKRIDFGAYSSLKTKISDDELELNTISSDIGRLSAEIKALQERITKAIETTDKIKAIDLSLDTRQINESEWNRIEEAFSPKGIPALELSMIAPIIDRGSNKLLSTYGSRFKIETITQDYDSKGKNLVEKFKILVHDSMSSDVKNLPHMSGGQAVWITKAIQEATAKVYSERSGRTWLYSIMDEADAALDSDIIPVFYDMMDKAMNGKRKLISVSHSSEAKASINKIVDITRFFVNYGE